MKDFTVFSFVVLAIFSSSCKNSDQTTLSNRGHIVLNDSSTIVTETDSQYLRDEFADLVVKPKVADVPAAKEVTNTQTPTSVPVASPVSNVEINQSGFTIDYGSFKALLTGITTKEYKKQDPAKEYGVSYQVIGGDLTKSQLVFSGVKTISISQRYQSNLDLKNNSETLDLKSMGTHTSDWADVKVQKKGNQFVADLSVLQSLDFKQISNANLKNAVEKELRAKRANTQTVKQWLDLISKVRTAKDKPCNINLNNVQWRVTGTDNQGKAINKLIRIDV